jgi:hypothetical protein
MDEAIGCFVVLIAFFCIWASYELYHQMRAFEAFAGPWIGYGLGSLFMMFLGSAILRSASE